MPTDGKRIPWPGSCISSTTRCRALASSHRRASAYWGRYFPDAYPPCVLYAFSVLMTSRLDGVKAVASAHPTPLTVRPTSPQDDCPLSHQCILLSLADMTIAERAEFVENAEARPFDEDTCLCDAITEPDFIECPPGQYEGTPESPCYSAPTPCSPCERLASADAVILRWELIQKNFASAITSIKQNNSRGHYDLLCAPSLPFCDLSVPLGIRWCAPGHPSLPTNTNPHSSRQC